MSQNLVSNLDFLPLLVVYMTVHCLLGNDQRMDRGFVVAETWMTTFLDRRACVSSPVAVHGFGSLSVRIVPTLWKAAVSESILPDPLGH